jgi:hypothetical protein
MISWSKMPMRTKSSKRINKMTFKNQSSWKKREKRRSWSKKFKRKSINTPKSYMIYKP